jgi:DNA-binding NarL/FixJ family response regulator
MDQRFLPDGENLPDLFTLAEWNAIAEHARLSRRQSQVARLLCRGVSIDAVADTLSIAKSTVRLHVRGLFQRLRVRDGVGMVVRLVFLHRELDGTIDLRTPSRERRKTVIRKNRSQSDGKWHYGQ